MSNELIPINPSWLPKSIGDLQTAPEMNEVMAALKHNAEILQQLILLLSPQVPLQTENKLFANAINEIFLLASAAGEGGSGDVNIIESISRNGVAIPVDGSKNVNIPIFSESGAGLVPQRVGAVATKYLREDGQWHSPPQTEWSQTDW